MNLKCKYKINKKSINQFIEECRKLIQVVKVFVVKEDNRNLYREILFISKMN